MVGKVAYYVMLWCHMMLRCRMVLYWMLYWMMLYGIMLLRVMLRRSVVLDRACLVVRTTGLLRWHRLNRVNTEQVKTRDQKPTPTLHGFSTKDKTAEHPEKILDFFEIADTAALN